MDGTTKKTGHLRSLSFLWFIICKNKGAVTGLNQFMGISVLSFDRLKIHSAMLAQRADDIFRKFIAFIDVSADFAYPAFFALGLWLWLYMFLVVGVSHGILIAHDSMSSDEHSVSAEIHIVFYLQGHESIDIFVQEYQAVVGVVYFLSGKFIGASAGLEAELLKNRERSICGQALLDHVVRSLPC